jgi:hypothetical protein
MNIKNMAHRVLGLLPLLLLLAVDGVTLKIAPTEAGVVYAVVSTTLLAVACVVAGYFLRAFWALLIVPLVFWESAYLFGVLTLFTARELYFVDAILLVILSIPIALFALLGVFLGKRSARTVAALAAS